MKKIIAAVFILYFAASGGFTQNKDTSYSGQIYLYGEQHGVKKIIDKELELWQRHYKNGLRHLFLELPYYTAEYLNIWLTENGNSILEEIYNDWEGTAFHNRSYFDFFINIKKHCPKTVFHGTDVGHQHNSTGLRFLKYLETEKLKNSSAYRRTQEIIEQGIKYYNENNPKNMTYRENMMAENFIYELKRTDNSSIMGIYGSAHTGLDSLDITGTVPCMAKRLKALYGNNIFSEDLSPLAKEIEPIRTEKITIANKTYKAYYYGKQNLNGFKGFLYREFWRLENAYAGMKTAQKTGDWLPDSNYPMKVEAKCVYVIDYTKIDKTKIRLYYISDGIMRNGQYITENISLE